MAPGVAKSFVKEFYKVLNIKYPECNYGDGILETQYGKEVLETEYGNLTNRGVYEKLKEYRKTHRLIMNPEGYEYLTKLMLNRYCKTLDESDVRALIKMTESVVEDATHQAMEAVIHNLNSMHSRAGKETACPNHGKPWVAA